MRAFRRYFPTKPSIELEAEAWVGLGQLEELDPILTRWRERGLESLEQIWNLADELIVHGYGDDHHAVVDDHAAEGDHATDGEDLPVSLTTGVFNQAEMMIEEGAEVHFGPFTMSIEGVITLITLFFLLAELFTEFYNEGEHAASARYLFLGLDGHTGLTPWIWTAAWVMNIAASEANS